MGVEKERYKERGSESPKFDVTKIENRKSRSDSRFVALFIGKEGSSSLIDGSSRMREIEFSSPITLIETRHKVSVAQCSRLVTIPRRSSERSSSFPPRQRRNPATKELTLRDRVPIPEPKPHAGMAAPPTTSCTSTSAPSLPATLLVSFGREGDYSPQMSNEKTHAKICRTLVLN